MSDVVFTSACDQSTRFSIDICQSLLPRRTMRSMPLMIIVQVGEISEQQVKTLLLKQVNCCIDDPFGRSDICRRTPEPKERKRPEPLDEFISDTPWFRVDIRGLSTIRPVGRSLNDVHITKLSALLFRQNRLAHCEAGCSDRTASQSISPWIRFAERCQLSTCARSRKYQPLATMPCSQGSDPVSRVACEGLVKAGTGGCNGLAFSPPFANSSRQGVLEAKRGISQTSNVDNQESTGHGSIDFPVPMWGLFALSVGLRISLTGHWSVP